MASIATTEHPRATAPRPQAGKNFNLRALFAGGAATILLIAAGVVVFGSLAAYVAFNGLPVGGGNGGSDTVAVEASAADANASAPAGAAAGLAAAPGAVAATPAAGTAIAPAPGSAAAAAAAAANGTATTGTTAPGTTGTTPGTTPTGTTPTGTTPTTPSTGSSTGTSTGPVGNAVQGVENVASGAGVDLPLSDTTSGITDPVDQTVQDTLDGVGGVVGNPNLGQQVGGTVNNVTGGLLGN